jgi:hypothetical protein
MSWKSFVTAGLLCVIASPVFAAPTVSIVPGGTFASNRLNADGDYVWNVRLFQSSPIVDVDDGGPLLPGSPLGAELGFRETVSEVLNAVNMNDGFDFNTNPGNGIFGWETLTDTDGSGSTNNGTPCAADPNCTVGDPNADPDDEPTGVQFSTALDEVFSALGSVDYLTDADGKNYIQITVNGPSTTGTLGTNLQMLGDYGGNGRIAELNDAFNPANPTGPGNPFSINHDTYATTVSFTAKAGDANLDGSVGAGDYAIWLSNVGAPSAKWYQGDFNGDGSVGAGDYAIWLANVGTGGGSGGAVPEPATMAMVALAGLGVIGLRRRHS